MQAYSDSRQQRYSQVPPQPPIRDMNNGSNQQQQPPSAYAYEAYHTPSVPSHPQSMAASPIGTPRTRTFSGDGDVAMEDADPYNRHKYPSRPSHQHRPSGPYVPHEDSSAARRYSPMKALSPSSHFPQTPQQQTQSTFGTYNSQAHRHANRPLDRMLSQLLKITIHLQVGLTLTKRTMTAQALKHFTSIVETAASTSSSDSSWRAKPRPVLSFFSHRPAKRCFWTRNEVTKAPASAIRLGSGCSKRAGSKIQKAIYIKRN